MMMIPAAAPASNDNATNNNNPFRNNCCIFFFVSSTPRDEDPVTSLLGGGGGGSAATTNIKSTFQEKPSSVPPSTPNRTPTESNNTQPSAPCNEELTNALSNLLLTNQLPQSSISTSNPSSERKGEVGTSCRSIGKSTYAYGPIGDFETNFDRALLAIGESNKERSNNSSQQQQSGGEDAAERKAAANSLYEELNSPSGTSFYNSNRRQSSSNTTSVNNRNNSNNNNDSLLLSELTEAKSRITHLETSTPPSTPPTLTRTNSQIPPYQPLPSQKHTTNTQLELRMSRMETDHAQRTLLTQSAVEANKRAAEGYEVAQSVRMDKEYVDGLEAKVVALQDWALASTERRVGELEAMVELLKRTNGSGGNGGSGGGEGMISLEDGMNINDLIPLKKVGGATGSSASSLASTQGGERILWTKSSSLVVVQDGGHSFIELGSVQIESYETVTLRWKFDLTREEEDIYFSILKGICEDKRKQRSADACFRSRHVKGGGGGCVGSICCAECLYVGWSNEMSWFRPKTIKWTVEAVAIEWSD
ncbi:hypothetical protein QTG54_002516 [Skeletonema marinoi]|uniref:GOLD domain-containing protein n=1 Tax=Skeletonema marinoi TaxID=267567 RepID=A0AAD8YKX5_9STRA|nr:hypothetical protein QTG54_002516 [Skeletonema marinoi]